MAAPTPIPALAPVDRPLFEFGARSPVAIAEFALDVEDVVLTTIELKLEEGTTEDDEDDAVVAADAANFCAIV